MTSMTKGKERAIRLQEKGMQMSEKADYVAVTYILKFRADLVQQLKKKCIDLGLMTESGEINEGRLHKEIKSFLKEKDEQEDRSP